MKFHVVIPARYASTRLPGKPLADIVGQTMIERVYRQARLSLASSVIVATDHQDVFDKIKSFGGQVLMTRMNHVSGTDRLAEVAEQMNMEDEDILVNVQGDEPLIPAEVIEQVASNLARNPQCDCATLCEPVKTSGEFRNPAVVKVVSNDQGEALYFSRAPVPWPRELAADIANSPDDQALPAGFRPMRHIGIYAYRVGLLRRFTVWQPASLELTESLEQLRILANGRRIHVAEACAEVPGGVDTQEDLDRVRTLVMQAENEIEN